MSITLIALILGLLSALSFGLADFFGAKASKRLGPFSSALSMQVATTALYVVYYVLFVHRLPVVDPQTFGYTAMSAVLIGLGTCVLYRAFEVGPVSLASPLSAAYPLVATLIGVGFFHAHLNGWQMFGVLLLVAGIMTVSGLFGVQASERKLSLGPRLALTATLVWGLGYPLLGKAIESAGWQVVTLLEMLLMVVVMSVALVLRTREPIHVKSILAAPSNPFILGTGLTMIIAEVAINIGFDRSQTAGALVLAISSTYPALTILLALRHFKERMALSSGAGVGATIGGVVLVLLG